MKQPKSLMDSLLPYTHRERLKLAVVSLLSGAIFGPLTFAVFMLAGEYRRSHPGEMWGQLGYALLLELLATILALCVLGLVWACFLPVWLGYLTRRYALKAFAGAILFAVVFTAMVLLW